MCEFNAANEKKTGSRGRGFPFYARFFWGEGLGQNGNQFTTVPRDLCKRLFLFRFSEQTQAATQTVANVIQPASVIISRQPSLLRW
jgi:hypothetical protein